LHKDLRDMNNLYIGAVQVGGLWIGAVQPASTSAFHPFAIYLKKQGLIGSGVY